MSKASEQIWDEVVQSHTPPANRHNAKCTEILNDLWLARVFLTDCLDNTPAGEAPDGNLRHALESLNAANQALQRHLGITAAAAANFGDK